MLRDGPASPQYFAGVQIDNASEEFEPKRPTAPPNKWCRRTWVDYAQNAASLGRASPNRLDFEQAVDANLAVAYTSELTEAGRRMTNLRNRIREHQDRAATAKAMVSAQDNELANLHLREELRLNAAMRKLRRFTPYGDLEGLASQWEFMGSTGAPSVDLVAEALARETEEVSPTAEQTKAPPSGTPSSHAPARKSTEARDANWESVASTNVAPRKQS